jgi:hypothetical protein
VPSMNIDTAARSLAETLKLSRRKMGARRVELRLEAPPPARTPWPNGANSQSYRQRLVRNARQAPSHLI